MGKNGEKKDREKGRENTCFLCDGRYGEVIDGDILCEQCKFNMESNYEAKCY